MPLLMALLGGLLTIVGSVVGRVLLALGLSYVTYSGFDLTIGWLKSQIQASIGSMPGEVVSFLGFLWLDKAIGVIFSAYAAAMVIKLAGSATMTKLVRKG